MPVADTKDVVRKASAEGYAVGAFNVTGFIQMKAVVEAATELRAPVIIQTSVTPSKFWTKEVIVAAYRALAGGSPVPISLHLDHCTDVQYCKDCATAGYTSVMIDASKESFEENIRRTKEVCDYAHALGVAVEGELGTISGVEDQIKVLENEALLCDPDSAAEFVERTGVDLFAPAIGTAHGVYRTANPFVDFDRLQAIRDKLRARNLDTPLVIHGGTGLPEETVRRLVSLGGAKFNVSTELKHVLIDSTFNYIQSKREEYDPGKVDRFVLDATKQAVSKWMRLLGSEGKA